MPLLAITLTGFCSTIAQIIVLRELWVLFLGNELASGLVFAAWLLWNALGNWCSARWLAPRRPGIQTIATGLVLMALLLPATLLLIRGAGLLWHLPPGELVPLGRMVLIALSATGLICPLAGALFSLCWARQGRAGAHRPRPGPLLVYWGEALGSALGGMTFYFVFLEHL